MAAHSNRSPSPISSRPNNPNPRNSESNSSIRRSFSGSSHYSKPSILTNSRRLDPITPANSPSVMNVADFARRRSMDREEKENDEKDSVLRTSKLQSPAKGCKNFMAPTISAASKFTPSPRKKVLVERNDPVRTSISLSDGKAMFFSDMPNAGDDLEKKPDSSDLESKKAAAKPPKKVTFLDIHLDSSESIVTDSDGLELESNSTDPSLPPYDPKTNYLSPRPQFIRYRPNPRVLTLLNKEKWLEPDDSLMGDIMAEGLSDSDEGGDEFQNQEMESAGVVIGDSDEGAVESQNQEMDSAAASADMVIGVDEEIEAESVLSEPVSESLPVSEEGVVQSNEKKPRSWPRLMCFSMILTLLLAGFVLIYVTNSPPFDGFLVQGVGFSDLGNLYQQSREAVASARLSLGLLARHVHHVSANSVAMVVKLVSEMGEGEKRVPLQFMNLSDLQEITLSKGNFQHIVENLDEDEFEEEMDSEIVEEEENLDAEMDTLEEEEAYEEVESDHLQDLHNQEELNSADQSAAEVAELEPETLQDFKNQEGQKHQEAANEVELERLETEKPQIDSNLDTIRPESTPVEEGIFVLNAVRIASIFAGLLAFAAAAFMYKRNHFHHQHNESKVEQVLAKQKDNNAHQEKELSQSWQAESYCPSEMSGSFQTESYSMREVQSSERKARKYPRRESLASSSRFSIESPSYGSFTTYEKIPINSSGYGDEEIITPVRRSSRIRNHQQVTSP